MGDEASLGNRIDDVTISNNVFEANNHAGIVIGSNVGHVEISRNTFERNGREGISIADDPTIADVRIEHNLISQPANGVCAAECDGFPRAHIAVGARARRVTVRTNRYRPGPPIVIGARDRQPR